MAKCSHGCHIPSWSPDPNLSPYCSGCAAPYEVEKNWPSNPNWANQIEEDPYDTDE